MVVNPKFKSSTYHVLTVTYVGDQGLDINSIKSVVNFDMARDMVLQKFKCSISTQGYWGTYRLKMSQNNED